MAESTILKDTFKTLKEVFIKPATGNNEKLADVKTAGIFAGIAAVAYLIIELINAIIKTVAVKSCSFFTGKCETKVDFDNLNDFDFFKTLGDNVLTILGVVAVVSIVVYIMGLVFKKQPKFMKLVAIVTAGLAPLFVAGFVSTIAVYIWTPLALFIFFAGMTLSLAYTINAISKEIVLEGDKKLFFHVATIVITFVVAYFILTSVAKDTAAGSYIKLLGL